VIPALIGLFFGLLWLVVGATGVPRAAAAVVVAVGILVFGLAAWRVIRRGSRRNRFDRRYYAAAVIAELVGIAFAQHWLSVHGHNDMLFPVVGVIVGLHFVGLWLAASDRRYLWLAAALVAINLAGILLPFSRAGRAVVSGFGSSLSLLIAASA
jgi:hypothetical protein